MILKHSDPTLWPQLIRQFRMAMTYRREKAEGRPARDDGNETGDMGQGIGDKGSADAAAAELVPPNTPLPTSGKPARREPVKVAAATAPVETMPSEPPLRPALKAGDHKRGDSAAAKKSNDVAAAKPAAKVARRCGDF